jgi:HPt (histidine-containing phosphotransfer) domain-containing protein
MDAYLAKPFLMDELFGKIDALIAGRPKGSGAAAAAEGLKEVSISPQEFFDREALLRRVGGKEALVVELIGYFLKDLPIQIEDMSKALADGDFSLLGRHAHRLKGAAATMCAHRSAALADRIQLAAKAENLLIADELLKELREQYDGLNINMKDGGT